MNRTFSFLVATLAVMLIAATTVRVHTDASPSTGTASTAAAAASHITADAAPTQAPVAEANRQRPAQGSSAKEKGPKAVDPDRAYKANCTRCHSEVPKLEPRAMKTVVMHMRVRANLTDAEARAIAEYLTR